MKRNTPWSQAGPTATLTTPTFRAEVQIDRPAHGLSGLRSLSASDRLFGVELPDFPDPVPLEMLVDCYVRQPDLIATYERLGADHLRAQIDWRQSTQVTRRGQLEGLLLIVSLQTDRLDARPLFRVSSRFTCSEFWWAPPSQSQTLNWQPVDTNLPQQSDLFVARLPGGRDSLVIMAMPSDVIQVAVQPLETPGRWQLTYELLGEHLEKGVIRRAQLAVWQIAQEADQALAAELWRGFLLAPPPLTT